MVYMKPYVYRFWGLNVRSSIPLPEFPVCKTERFDILLTEGFASGYLREENLSAQGWLFENHIYFRRGQSGTLLDVTGVGNIWVGISGEIVLERLPGVSLEESRLFILGSGFGIFLLQRGAFPMHGSTVAKEGHCLMFTGPSGAGKSTLTAFWISKGHALVADDVSLVHFRENGKSFVQPASPHIKLWEDSAQALKHDPDSLPRIMAGWEKRWLPVSSSTMSEEAVLDAIFLLTPEICEVPRIELLNGTARFSSIAGNIYRGEAISWLGQLANHFVFSSRLAAAVPVFRLTRPANTFALEEIYELVEHSLASLKDHESKTPR